MAPPASSPSLNGERDLLGQTVLVIGGSSGIGLETARLARGRGADIILTARDPDRLHRAGLELGASIAAFDVTDFDRLERFFDALPAPIDHLLVTGPGPCQPPLAGFDLDAARRHIDAHLLLPLQVARYAAIRLTRTGATSSARLLVMAGSAAVSAAMSAGLAAGRRLPVSPMNSRVPPGRTLPAASRATCSGSRSWASRSRRAASRPDPASGG